MSDKPNKPLRFRIQKARDVYINVGDQTVIVGFDEAIDQEEVGSTVNSNDSGTGGATPSDSNGSNDPADNLPKSLVLTKTPSQLTIRAKKNGA